MLRSFLAWRQFSLRTLLLAMFVAAVFCGGYRFGFHVGQDKRLAAEQTEFDSLVYLITTTIAPDRWEDTDGIDSAAAVDYGCRLWVASADTPDNNLPSLALQACVGEKPPSLALQACEMPGASSADPFASNDSQVTPPTGSTTGE